MKITVQALGLITKTAEFWVVLILIYKSTEGDYLQVGIYFHERLCVIRKMTELGRWSPQYCGKSDAASYLESHEKGLKSSMINMLLGDDLLWRMMSER